mmetsp:Transcript_11475/g.37596  ORF Transcript_11475/g.37596 Transcript_11475/m.37596 type:complete len:420 (+) Transcript_11475:169-1428(+)
MEHPSFAPYNNQHTNPPPTTEQSRLEQTRLDEKKRLKRAANRRSACTSRVRKKQFVEEMTAANERLAVYGAILARAPPTITVDEACAVRFASRSARELLGLDLSEALDGLNLVDLLAADDHQPAAARWVRAAAAGAKAEAPRWDPGAPPAADWRPLEWSTSQGSVNVVSSDNSGGSDEARSGSDDGRNSSEDSDERPAVEDSAEKRDTSPPPALPDLIGAAGAGGGFPRKRCYADVVDRQPVAAPPPPPRHFLARAYTRQTDAAPSGPSTSPSTTPAAARRRSAETRDDTPGSRPRRRIRPRRRPRRPLPAGRHGARPDVDPEAQGHDDLRAPVRAPDGRGAAAEGPVLREAEPLRPLLPAAGDERRHEALRRGRDPQPAAARRGRVRLPRRPQRRRHRRPRLLVRAAPGPRGRAPARD